MPIQSVYDAWQEDDKALLAMVKNGKYSDLMIQCQAETFLVHKIFVCSGCPDFFDKACSGPFKESTTDVISMHGHDPAALRMMIEFLYFCTFEPHGDLWIDDFDLDDEFEIDQTKESHHEKYAGDSELKDKCFKRCLVFAAVYAVADKYNLSELKQMAQRRLKARISMIGISSGRSFNEHWRTLVSNVYDSTPPASDRALRDIVVNAAVDWLLDERTDEAMLENKVWAATLTAVPDSAVDCLKLVGKRRTIERVKAEAASG